MKAENIKDTVNIYFDYFNKKIGRLIQMIKNNFVEEALILAFCYLDSLASIRYKPKKGRENRDNFIKVLFNYSGYGEIFAKISWTALRMNCKDDKTKLTQCKEIEKILVTEYRKLYGEGVDVDMDISNEMDKENMIKYLSEKIKNIDKQNLEKNLDQFSYAAVLYEKYRCGGVHAGEIPKIWQAGTGPIFEKNDKGEDIYYRGNTLRFSKEIIMLILGNISNSIRNECIKKGMLPWKLWFL